jgi:MFS family permease
MAQFQPADNLRSRTFIGLLIAQFLAAFNDQAIHASAMFYAINTLTLTETQAITWMPILFYAPWALFCTLAGFLADKYSKQNSLIAWKFVEVPITLLALAGFWLGYNDKGGYSSQASIGAWVVLSTVFLMGLHSAFFVPAKYGVMPEILTPRMLSRGNGVLESLSFIAIILGTVAGGILSTQFRGQEYIIGIVLVSLACVGSLASLLIRRMPAANPDRTFPPYLYGPLYQNLKTLLTSRPLAFAVLGIAFFTFIVAFMRATVYLHGQTEVPMWSEAYTSEIVGLVALGIGLGSPLVGFLSGGKVELGLIPLGAVGMIVATAAAAMTLSWVPGFIVCIVVIGFSTGFYLVPLFTLLQHRAPKTSKGDAIATSNFINVTGAILASVVLFGVSVAATRTGFTPLLEQTDFNGVVTLAQDPELEHGRPRSIAFIDSAGKAQVIIDNDNTIEIDPFREPFRAGDKVQISTYSLGDSLHYRLRSVVIHEDGRIDVPHQVPAHDKRRLPALLFLAAAGLTFLTLLLLWGQLGDLFYRTDLWFRFRGKSKIETAGSNHVPSDGPAILATNAPSEMRSLQVLLCVDRLGRYLMIENHREAVPEGPRALVLVEEAQATTYNWQTAEEKADWTLERGEVVGLPLLGHAAEAQVAAVYANVQSRRPVPVVPVYVEARHEPGNGKETVYILFGDMLPASTPVEEVQVAIRKLGQEMADRRQRGEAALPVVEKH